MNLLDKLDELAAIYSVPWGLRNAFKGDVLGIINEYEQLRTVRGTEPIRGTDAGTDRHGEVRCADG